MAKITVTLQCVEYALALPPRKMHGEQIKLQVLPKPGDFLKSGDGYAEIIRVVHDIKTGEITLVIK